MVLSRVKGDFIKLEMCALEINTIGQKKSKWLRQSKFLKDKQDSETLKTDLKKIPFALGT